MLTLLLNFNTLWKEFSVESKSEALCAQEENTGRTGLQIVGHFQEPLLWGSCISLYLEKHKNPSWWKLFLLTSRNLMEIYVLDYMYFPLHQNHIYTDLPPSVSLKQSLIAIWSAVSQAAVLILPKIKLNWQLLCCTFS